MAGTHVAGALEIQMMMGLARLQSDVTKAKGMVRNMSRSVERSVSIAKNALGMLGIGLGVGYFVSLIKGSIDAADRLKDLHKSTNIAVEDLAGLRLFAQQTGTDLDSLAKGINKMSVEMGKDPEKFRALGVTAKNNKEAFQQFADIFNQLPDIQQRNALSMAVFGKSWEQMAPALSEGGKKIGETIELGAKLSGITKQITDDADAFNDMVAELTATGGLLNRQVGATLPLLNTLLEDLVKLQRESTGAGDGFNILLETLKPIVIVGGLFIDTFSRMGKEFAGWAAQIAALARGDFKAFAAIGKEMQGDAVKDAAAWEAWRQKILDVGVAVRKTGKDSVEVDAKTAAATAARAAAFLTGNKAMIAAEKERQRLRDLDTKGWVAHAQKIIDENERVAKELADAEIKKNEVNEAARTKSLEDGLNSWAIYYANIADIEAAAAQIGLNARIKAEEDRIAAVKKANDKILAEQKRSSDEIERMISDGLMRGFESGKGWAENFRDMLVNMFKTLVLRPLIQPIAQAGANLVTGAASSAFGSSMFGNVAGSAASGGALASVGGWMGTAGGVPVTSTLGAVASGAGYAGAGSTGMLGTAGAAMGPAGWISLAALAAYAIFSEKGGPKNAVASIGSVGGNAAIDFANFQGQWNSAPGSQAEAFYQTFNDWLAQLPAQVREASIGLSVEGGPDKSGAEAFTELQAKVLDVAKAMNLTVEEMQKLAPLAATAAREQIKFAMLDPAGQLESQTKALGDAFTAAGIPIFDTRAAFSEFVSTLELTTQSGLNTLSVMEQWTPTFLQMMDATDRAQEEAAAATEKLAEAERQLADRRQSWQDQLDLLTGATTQNELDLARETDTATQSLMRQVFAQQDLAAAIDAANAVLAEGASLNARLAQLSGDNTQSRILELQALDPANRAIQLRIWELEREQSVAQSAASATNNMADAYRNQMQAQHDALKGMVEFGKSIKEFLHGLDVGTTTATPQQQFAAAQAKYLEDLSKSRSGDIEAQGRLAREAQTYIDKTQQMYASGPQTQAIIAQIKSELGALPEVENFDANLEALKAIWTALQEINTSTQSSGIGIISAVDNVPFAITEANLELLAGLGEMFDEMDIDVSGGLTFAEFSSVMAGKASDSTLQALFDLTDLNHDGLISELEATRASGERNTATLINALLPALDFEALDINVSGGLTNEEFLAGLAGKATDAEIKRLFAITDANGDGIITAIELSTANMLAGLLPALKFDELDINVSGGLTNEEFKAGLVGKATDAEITRLFTLTDTNGDGIITAIELNAAAAQGTTAAVYSQADYFRDWGVRAAQQWEFNDIFRTQNQQIFGELSGLRSDEWARWNTIYARQYNIESYLYGILDTLNSGINVHSFASGGSFGGGLRLVGEHGPELEATGPSRIFSTSQTSAMLSGAGGEEVAKEVRDLKATVKELLSRIAHGQSVQTGVIEKSSGKVAKATADAEWRKEVAPRMR